MEGVDNENKKKKDGRANNGALKGVYRGQGRPPKAREKKLGNYALGAMKKVFGSEEKAWLELAKQSQNTVNNSKHTKKEKPIRGQAYTPSVC